VHAERRPGSPQAATPGRVRAVRVDIEIDDLDTALALHMPVAGMPRPLAKPDVADLGEVQAFPLAAGRQGLAALARELVGQRDLLPIGMAENDGTEFTRIAVV